MVRIIGMGIVLGLVPLIIRGPRSDVVLIGPVGVEGAFTPVTVMSSDLGIISAAGGPVIEATRLLVWSLGGSLVGPG